MEIEQKIIEELRPVSTRIAWEAASIPQTQLIGKIDIAPYRGDRATYVIIAPETSNYDQENLNRIASLIDDTISVKPSFSTFLEFESKSKIYYPKRAYSEKIKPIQIIPGHAASEKGKKNITQEYYRTAIVLTPDKEMGELLLLYYSGDMNSVIQAIKEIDIMSIGAAFREDYERDAWHAIMGLDKLLVYMPKKIAQANDLIIHLSEEHQAKARKIAYLNIAIALGGRK